MLALSYVTLEIRRLYHGPILTGGVTGGAEQYTYSIAWLAFGVALLGIGIVFNSQRARLASAVVIALTILKAFLIDMSTLTGVYRALSFMCLGLVLVAIGWLYQRILFRRQAGAGRAEPARIVERSLGRAAQFRSVLRFRRLGFDWLDLGALDRWASRPARLPRSARRIGGLSGGCSERGRATARAISICAAP